MENSFGTGALLSLLLIPATRGGTLRNLRRVWQNVTPWQVRLDWFRAELASPPESLRFDPAEVEEILWITLAGLLAAPDKLDSNAPFLKKMIAGEIG